MLRQKFYYGVKPLVPVTARLALRRWFALRKRRHVGDVWPILPGSERPPTGWPGWPEGKKFAFVLTHDVEGQRGLDRCRKLMELELKWGFRSCFNFIPEGDYRVSKELRDELTGHGFEVGVHDLRHDGKLCAGRKNFVANASKINRYLEEWGAVGFRSGFMIRNLDWFQDLNIKYDASTFDTDPFEPQPDGAGTVFPFWNGGGPGRGYVELPYTLPQDSTLFLIFKERDTNIWLRKLDWIVTQGGMALLNVHPDYIQFPGDSSLASNYPVELYENLLRHISERYANLYWTALPRNVAQWYKQTCVSAFCQAALPEAAGTMAGVNASSSLPRNRPQKAMAVVLYSYYESDARPMREAEALARAGFMVDVIALRQKPGDATREMMNGVHVLRVPLRRRRGGKIVYLLQYGWFLLVSFTLLTWRSLRRPYQIVHIHNMPDILVFSGLVAKLRGAKIILDLHDPMPELFLSIFRGPNELLASNCLAWMEQRSIAFAHKVLTPNLAFKKIFVARGCPDEKVQIVMNSPDPGIFCGREEEGPARIARPPGEFVLMYHGLLVERHGLDLLIDALVTLRPLIPGIKLLLYGEMTDYMESVMQLVRENGLEHLVDYHGFKTLKEIAAVIPNIDLGVIPNRLNSFTRVNMPTRIFEYLALNKPVIVPKTDGILDYFKEDEILYFLPTEPATLAERILWAYQHPEELQKVTARGRMVYDKNSWKTGESRFVTLVNDLLRPQLNEDLVPSVARTTAAATGRPKKPLQGKRAIVITYSYYPDDPRPRREAEAMIEAGMGVDVICLQQQESEMRQQNVSGVNVTRLPVKRRREGKFTYVIQYSWFFLLSAFIAAQRQWRKPCALVHVHNMPDFLVFTGLVPKLCGVPVLLDLHDPMPELMISIFGLTSSSLSVRMLKYIEKRSIQFADAILTVNLICAAIFASRSCKPEKIRVIMNSPDERIFAFQPIREAPQWHSRKPFVLMYHGSIVHRHGLDLAIQALGMVRKKIPHAVLHVCGARTAFWESIAQWPASALEGVSYLGAKTHEEIVVEIDKSDLGLIPNRKSTFTQINTPTRLFEYLSRAKPVIAPQSDGVTSYFGPADLLYFSLGDVEDLADKIIYAYDHPEEVKQIVERGQTVYHNHKWSAEKERFLNVIETLVATKANSRSRAPLQEVVAAETGAHPL